MRALWTPSPAEREALEAACAQSWSPEEMRVAMARLSECLSPATWRALIALARSSDAMCRVLARRPGLAGPLVAHAAAGRQKPLAMYLAEARAHLRRAGASRERLHRAMRRYKYRELLLLSLRDVAFDAPATELGREASHLAEALVSGALEVLYESMVQRHGRPAGAQGQGVEGFCVLGLGKLGGEDLNFSSDIDLIYLSRGGGQTAGGPSGALDHASLYTRLAEELTRSLSLLTPDGFCFRVDLNLRPQGRVGALVHSLGAALAYYETLGRTWERAALLKARPIAGDRALGAEFLEGVSPFVWRRSLDLGAVDELRELKAQIDLRATANADDVKLGPGGIREIEFFANALQLVHGGKRPLLRERNTVRALRRLEHEGLIAAPDFDRLEEAYAFLRTVENRLQLVEERQTHALPPSMVERSRLAHGLGHPSVEAFEAALEHHRRFVREAFSVLLGRTAREELVEDASLATALDPEAPQDSRAAALAARGFLDVGAALAALDRLSRLGGPAARTQRLVAEVARSPDPDQALGHLAELVARLGSPEAYLSLLDSAPRARRRLLNLFGQSDYLAAIVLRHPELVDGFVQQLAAEVEKSPARIKEELATRIRRSEDPEQQLSLLRRFKNEETLRVGLLDIADEVSVQEVAAQLTAVAEGVLDEALFMAQAFVDERFGRPFVGARPATMVVVGMGKLGGNELGYHSDLDLIFVYSGRGDAETSGGSRGRVASHEYFARVAQRLIGFLQAQFREGILYRVDTRLRPSGNQGPLVVSEEAFRTHHETRAQLWERQALIKARCAAGDGRLFERLTVEVIAPLVYDRPLPEDAGAEIDRLRSRMELELGKETARAVNPKLGHGGLVDVEFATQFLQLQHGSQLSRVRRPGTLDALHALEATGCLPVADARTLIEGYLFLRRVENRLRLIHGRPLSLLPLEGRALSLLARRLGYHGPQADDRFARDYRAYTTGVRDVYARVIGRTPC